MREAKRDCDNLNERMEEEESLATLEELEQIHSEANEMVIGDERTLTEERDQYSSDMDWIGKFSQLPLILVCHLVSHIAITVDRRLSVLKVAMDQSDVEYAEIMKELKTEMFSNRCHQERLGEHLWRLQKKEGELEIGKSSPGTEENSRNEMEEELCGNRCHQDKLKEKLEELVKTLRVVEATYVMEEFLQDKADEVG